MLKRINKELAKLGAEHVSVAEAYGGWSNVFVSGEATPLALLDTGDDVEIMLRSPSGEFHFEDSARDFPGLARKLFACVQDLTEQGILE